ncbi:hypothetical protein O181_075352 [Austropuccinia psidii MF-1]|uniref:Reverse transcriptase/retrotransposon-derived protein RNase H-like domain-containing protein n=1 Tax=Austropuccinia psidii MF-1 TaxID=1389203 RepID=A0A9Q3FEU3_9BASI|nr:hypothetical protein [Austropuccinia psidii MF-1]
MDSLKGFHKVFLIPKTRKLLRIITHCGIYGYLRIAFGIKNAPSHYQRMINTILPTELSEGGLIIYIDDIIICSLPRVFDKVTGVNIKISLKKCNFGFEELKALGHIVSGLSLGIDKNKLAAVLLKPIPQNKKEMMSFIGFSSYYRQHLKEFAILAKSLYRICDQQKVFEMTQKRIEAYEKIRKALTEEPLLLIPDWNIPFKLYIDECVDVLGAALHQVQIIDEKPTEGPVCYISRQIKPTEDRYGPSRMDCLCLKYVEMANSHSIVHKAGKIHTNADGLSRWALANTPDNPDYVPLEAEPQNQIERINITDIGTKFFEEVRESYKQDNNCHILTSLLDKD